MSDLISRQAAIEVCDWWQHEYDESASRIDDIIHCIAEDIEKLPSADVRENVRGEWRFSPDHAEGVCSVCQFKIYGRPYQNTYLIVPYNYCPNCGADMRERRIDGEEIH